MSPQNRVVTVTINPAIDQTLTIPNFTPGEVNRVQHSRLDAGGKGINVASFLADFGNRTTATGFLGVENDEIFRRLFARKGIQDRCIRIAGQTRIGVKIVDEERRRTTDINFPGLVPGRADLERLLRILKDLAHDHSWFVLAGSVPSGVSPAIYRDMLAALEGTKVAVDTSGAALAEAVLAGPTLIKPNVRELEELVGVRLESPAAIVQEARALMSRHGISEIIVSLGSDGAIFLDDDEAIWAVPPAVGVKSTVGAGDAMVAGALAGKMRGLSLADRARLATGFSVSAITHIGSGLPSIAAVWEASERVTLQEAPVAFPEGGQGGVWGARDSAAH